MWDPDCWPSPMMYIISDMFQISHTKIIFISFATIRQPSHADVFIKARGKPLQKLRSEIVSHCATTTAPPTSRDASASPSVSFLAHAVFIILTFCRNPSSD